MTAAAGGIRLCVGVQEVQVLATGEICLCVNISSVNLILCVCVCVFIIH